MSMTLKHTVVLALTLIGLSASIPEAYAHKNWEAIIGAPPAAGSAEEQADVAALLNYQETRTEADCEEAASTEEISLRNLFGPDTGLLTEKEVKGLQLFWYKYLLVSGLKSQCAKTHFDRARPYDAFPEIVPCIHKPTGKSFPSGHTSVSRFFAHAFSIKFPERKEAFFARADQVALHRMLGGVHYPTDVEAGKKLADYLAGKYFSDDVFLMALYAE